MDGRTMLLEHVQNAVFRVCGSQPPMRWTETGNGRQLATMEDFKAISGWQGGADGSFQSENQGEDGLRTLTCIKDIFTSPDWIQMVTTFQKIQYSTLFTRCFV